VAVCCELGEQAGDRFDHRDRLPAEAQHHSPLDGLDVIEPQPCDPATGWL
jgi:hypothetical protein